MSDASPKEQRQQRIPLTQTVAGATAAVCSAFAGSFFGVAGTIVGTALGSVISTVVSALVAAGLTTTSTKLRLGRLPWKRLMIPMGVVAAIGLLVVTGSELAIGSPLSALVHGHTSTGGTTLGDLSKGKPGVPTKAPETPVPTTSHPPSGSSSAAPSESTGTETPTPSVTPTPSPSASATPSEESSSITPTQSVVPTPSEIQAPPTEAVTPSQ